MEGPIHFYCINLKHRGDRWQRFTQQPELKVIEKEYSFERFEGINGSQLDIASDKRVSLRTKRNIKENVRRDHEELDSAGGVGCYLSHVGVWKSFLERPEPYAIIFEDDAIIPDGFLGDLKKAMKESTLLPEPPDLWYFSRPMPWYFTDRARNGTPNSNVWKKRGPWTTTGCACFTAYLISKRGAQRLVENAFPIDMHVDMYSCLSGSMGNILTVLHKDIVIKPVSIKEHDTDIHNRTTNYICEVPSFYKDKGMILLSLPLVTILTGTLVGLWWLGKSKRR